MAKQLGSAAIAFALAVVILAMVGSSPVSGHGTLDQTFTGNPDCSYDNFKGSLATGSPIYQEFVPSMSKLVAIDVCSTVFNDDTAINVNIRNGAAAHLGPVIATMSTTANVGYQWLHFDLNAPLPVFPGEKLVIEMPSATDHNWIETCNEIFGTCDHIDQDQYPAGDSSSGSPADFVFRSYGGSGPTPTPRPDIAAAWADLNCSGQITREDGLLPMEAAASVAPAVQDECAPLGGTISWFGVFRTWGDLGCDGVADVRDTLVVFKYLAGLPSTAPNNCPAPNDPGPG
jgi:hypothetical protein